MLKTIISLMAGAMLAATPAHAGTIFSQDFSQGVGAKETVSSNVAGSWGVHDGFLGHDATYASNERSLYIANLGLSNYTGITLGFNLTEYVERSYDYVTWFTGHYDGTGTLVFTALGNLDQGYGSGNGIKTFQIADADRDQLFGFRFTSDHAIQFAGVQIRALSLTGTAIGSPVDVAGAVPEPATWAMMILGFTLVAGVVRRRKGMTRHVMA